MLPPGCRPVPSVHVVLPARPSVKTYPVAEVRASCEDRGHAHVDQEGLPVSQNLVLLLFGRRQLPLSRTCPRDPPSDFSVLTRAEEREGQRWVTHSGENNGKEVITAGGILGKKEPRVKRAWRCRHGPEAYVSLPPHHPGARWPRSQRRVLEACGLLSDGR